MKTKDVTITVKRLVQTAPYESVELSVSETIELEKKDDIEKIRSKALDELTETLEKKAKAFKKSVAKKDKG